MSEEQPPHIAMEKGLLLADEYEVAEDFDSNNRPRIIKAYNATQEPLCIKVVADIRLFRRQTSILMDVQGNSSGGLRITSADNIVRLIDHFEAEEEDPWSPFHLIVMERGVTTLEKYAITLPLPEKDSRTIFQGITDGVEVLHALNYVHGDLKPQNIMLFTSYENTPIWKIIDFDMTVKTGDMVQGISRDFCAPEVLRAHLKGLSIPAHPSQDMFSLGLILHTISSKRSLWGESPTYGTMHPDILNGNDFDISMSDFSNRTTYVLIIDLLRKDPSLRMTMGRMKNRIQLTDSSSPETMLPSIKAMWDASHGIAVDYPGLILHTYFRRFWRARNWEASTTSLKFIAAMRDAFGGDELALVCIEPFLEINGVNPFQDITAEKANSMFPVSVKDVSLDKWIIYTVYEIDMHKKHRVGLLRDRIARCLKSASIDYIFHNLRFQMAQARIEKFDTCLRAVEIVRIQVAQRLQNVVPESMLGLLPAAELEPFITMEGIISRLEDLFKEGKALIYFADQLKIQDVGKRLDAWSISLGPACRLFPFINPDQAGVIVPPSEIRSTGALDQKSIPVQLATITSIFNPVHALNGQILPDIRRARTRGEGEGKGDADADADAMTVLRISLWYSQDLVRNPEFADAALFWAARAADLEVKGALTLAAYIHYAHFAQIKPAPSSQPTDPPKRAHLPPSNQSTPLGSHTSIPTSLSSNFSPHDHRRIAERLLRMAIEQESCHHAYHLLGTLLEYADDPSPKHIQEALDLYAKGNEKGLPQAAEAMGCHYLSRDNIPEAIAWFERAAPKSYRAHIHLGNIYMRGDHPDGIRVDLARVHYMDALQAPSTPAETPPDPLIAHVPALCLPPRLTVQLEDARFHLGEIDARAGQDPEVHWKLITGTYPELSALRAYRTFRKSSLSPQDWEAAVGQYREAAAKGSATASLVLGYHYLFLHRGNGRLENALIFLEIAEDLGSMQSLVLLGLLYSHADYEQRDTTRAAEYFKKAHEAKEDIGSTFYATVLYLGEGVARNKARAVEILEENASDGHSSGFLNLDWCHRYDLRKEGMKGDPEAMFLLGKILMGNILAPRLPGIGGGSPRWTFGQASVQEAAPGEHSSLDATRPALEEMSQGSESLVQAYRQFEAAAKLDHLHATIAAFECCRYGEGTEVDEAKAMEYFSRAEDISQRLYGIRKRKVEETTAKEEAATPRASGSLAPKSPPPHAAKKSPLDYVLLGVTGIANFVRRCPPDVHLDTRDSKLRIIEACRPRTTTREIEVQEDLLPSERFSLLLRAADGGCPRAIALVMWCYKDGCGVKKNLEWARSWKDAYPEVNFDVEAWKPRSVIVPKKMTRAATVHK